jgi:hypothetical protein
MKSRRVLTKPGLSGRFKSPEKIIGHKFEN